MHKNSVLTILFLVNSVLLFGQYWQQKVEYKMDIDFNDSIHQYHGKQLLTYSNNSPDTIFVVYYHLYNNAFQPGSVMDVRAQAIPDPEKPLLKIQHYTASEIGFLHANWVKQDGKALLIEEQGTILKVILDKPLLPGKKTKLSMEFDAQVPIYTRRSGRYNQEGIAYSMAQWYPKLCEYDRAGWNTDPYVGREFYGVWGDFEVNINISSEFILGGTGIVSNPKEVKNGYGGIEGKPEGTRAKWKFEAKQVHDFVWAADKAYVHKIVPVNEDLEVHLLYKNDSAYAASWEKLASEMPRMFRYVNKKFGEYPYSSFSIIQAGDRGMEYPMATLMNGNRSYGSILGTTAHELMHQWYYGVLATNEGAYPWMDEGFSNYADAYVMNYMLENDSLSVPNYEKTRARVLGLIESDKNVPLRTHGDHYASSLVYSIGSYNKGTIYLNQLAYIIGQDKLDQSLLRYYNDWKFKHPDPEDFLLVAEKVSGIELDWYNDYYIYSMTKLDYGITSLFGSKDQSVVVLERKNDFIMPVDLEVVLLSGESYMYTIPLDVMRKSKENSNYENFAALPAWDWVKETYSVSLPFNVNDIYYLIIDPELHTLDVDFENNIMMVNSPIDADVIIKR
jgi:hypothetical protein